MAYKLIVLVIDTEADDVQERIAYATETSTSEVSNLNQAILMAQLMAGVL